MDEAERRTTHNAPPTSMITAAAVTPTRPALLLRVEEAAALLRVGRSTAYDLIRTGQLASVKIGGSRRVPRAAVEAFVDGLCTTASRTTPEGS